MPGTALGTRDKRWAGRLEGDQSSQSVVQRKEGCSQVSMGGRLAQRRYMLPLTLKRAQGSDEIEVKEREDLRR